MIEWFLIMVIQFSVGPVDKLEIPGEKPYLSIQDCNEAGREIANYLNQDFNNVKWRCVSLPKPI